ncbi:MULTISPECIES: putative baseplate assembly protein [Niastella]|uniref:Baseplate assembly protein n=1 Tax=Niastella soli TaxID=2821487 RepID=A0ABS3Z5U5_9BACT|nr:putative baseplate assembly protein [Niastella soli]MBO9205504.1 putative baseplate assembly protein [Niastella soli]
MNYFCCSDTRRNTIRDHPYLNGIDYVEVLDNESDPYHERQTTLFVHFLKSLHPGTLNISNLKIEGGERIKNIKVVSIAAENEAYYPLSPPTEEQNVLMVKVSEAGDFSTYTLRLVKDRRNDAPPDGFDTVLSTVDFSFKVLCPGDFDCKPACSCPTEPKSSPQINYLAKDYTSFRQLMLDRMALLLPGWKERNAADIGIVLVELLAYTADYLSYRQDAIATEAYLETARKRISIKRHARLVDYFMHDGCNGRAWLHVQVPPEVNGLEFKKGQGSDITKILTRVEELPAVIRPDSPEFEKAMNAEAKVFELMHDITLHAAHNEMTFYTWCGKNCCLPKGATSATIRGSFPHLKPGNILVLAEKKGPETGMPEDADPLHRHAVRLTKVTQLYDLACDEIPGSPLYSSPLYGSPPHYFPVTKIQWAQEDALPFPLCISTPSGEQDVSVALGNIVLVDHGHTIVDEKKSSLQPFVVPDITTTFVTDTGNDCNHCEPEERTPVLPRFRPRLVNGPLTYAAPFDLGMEPISAAALIKSEVQLAIPVITLHETAAGGSVPDSQVWKPKLDLLNSASNAKEFTVEQESNGIAYIRFGDNKQGARPASGTQLFASCRIGNGINGNVGANTLAHIVTNDAAVIAGLQQEVVVWNPLAAQGGTEAETIAEVKQYAPVAFRRQERAVTAADYEEFARRCNADVQKAAATFRWTGSWKTVFLSIDRFGGREVDPGFEKDLRTCLEKYRLAGFDLEIDVPIYVSLELNMEVCVHPQYIAGDVKKALWVLFSNQMLPDGQPGVFHPNNFSFGQPVYLSRLYAAAQSTPGVLSVKITRFQRQGLDNSDARSAGRLKIGRREIARLDNDPDFPERGVFRLTMLGGR